MSKYGDDHYIHDKHNIDPDRIKVIDGETHIRVKARKGTEQVWISQEKVQALARIGATYKEMGDFFGVHHDTLKWSFMEQIRRGRTEIKQALRKAQIKSALEGNVVMQIWLGKNLLNQSESGQVDEEEEFGDFTVNIQVVKKTDE